MLMKKVTLTLAMVALVGTSAWAEWGTSYNDPTKIYPTNTSHYGVQTLPSPDGGVWSVIYYVNTKNAAGETDFENVKYEYRVQYFNPEGVAQFEESGLLVSDYRNLSWTQVGNWIYVDSDSNAIVMVSDCRNSSAEYGEKSITAYKISKTGEFLWGEDGVALADPMYPDELVVQSCCVELEDHSYVFAWNALNGDSSSVCMQRLNSNGEPQWNRKDMTLDDENTGNPSLVASGDNTCILVYTRTASNVLYARKLDFEGSNVWGTDTRLYRGVWGSTPVHLQYDVNASGDGGALVGLCTDQEGINVEYPYLIYVDSDGKLGFSGVSDNGDVKLSYDEWRSLNIKVAPASDGSGFYAVWRELDANQTYMGINIQKVDKAGELLFGDESIALVPMEQQNLSYITMQPTNNGGVIAFYAKYADYFNQQNFAVRCNGEGEFVWPGNVIPLSSGIGMATGLEAQAWPGNKSFLLTWACGGRSETDKDSDELMLRFNEDGTFGGSGAGLKAVSMNGDALGFNGEYLTGAADEMVTVYSVDGKKVMNATFTNGAAKVNLPAGIYVANSNGETLKFSVK